MSSATGCPPFNKFARIREMQKKVQATRAMSDQAARPTTIPAVVNENKALLPDLVEPNHFLGVSIRPIDEQTSPSPPPSYTSLQVGDARPNTGAPKRKANEANDSPAKKLRSIADELEAMTRENTSLKNKVVNKGWQCNFAEHQLANTRKDIATQAAIIRELEKEKIKLKGQVAEVKKKLKGKEADSRQDRIKIRNLQKENKDLTGKVEKAKKGWKAFKEVGDFLDE